MSTLDEHARAGIDAIQNKRYDEAVSAFQSAIEVDGSRPDLHNALGMAYLHQGRVGDALPHLERAVELAEPYVDADVQDMKRHMHLSLAGAYEAADQPLRAKEVLEGAIAHWPEAVHPRLHLGQLLLACGAVEDGLAVYRSLADFEPLDQEGREAARAVVGSAEAFLRSEHPASIFLEAHAAEYARYFTEVLSDREAQGWLAEAARMARRPDGELQPIIPQAARPYAMQRVDLVNPEDNSVADVYNAADPMIVAVDGAEPLAQLPVLFDWPTASFQVQVSTRCPWHWLSIAVVFVEPGGTEALDERIGDWYLAGYNGEFGNREGGRFHYISDPDPLSERAVSYTVDLGRARYEAIPALLRRLEVLHAHHPLERVVFGTGRLAV